MPDKTCIFTAFGFFTQAQGAKLAAPTPQPASVSFNCIKDRCQFWHEEFAACKFDMAATGLISWLAASGVAFKRPEDAPTNH